jgi:hypothetical protein
VKIPLYVAGFFVAGYEINYLVEHSSWNVFWVVFALGLAQNILFAAAKECKL